MEEDELLNQEKVEKRLSPHPLSFMGLQSLCIFLIAWGLIFGWMVNFSDFRELFENVLLQIAVWGLVLLVVSIIASIIKVMWRIFFLYLSVVLVALGLIWWLNLFDAIGLFLPVYTVIVSIIGFLLVELFRRSHKYIISNQRIVFKGGVITKEQRTLRYDKISDVNTKQGILGQIFSFGTIIPISQSGFGLGSDQSLLVVVFRAVDQKELGYSVFLVAAEKYKLQEQEVIMNFMACIHSKKFGKWSNN